MRQVLLTDDEIKLLREAANQPKFDALKGIARRAERANTLAEMDYIARAREKFEEEGTLEFDDIPAVSESEDNGAYVAAWVWVADKDEEDES